MSAHVLRDATVEPTPMTTTLENLEKLYGRAFLDRRYHGIYLNRSPVRHARDVQELYGVPPAGEAAGASLDSLYPQSLAKDVEQLSEKLEQKYALEALRDQVAQAPGGIIRHNGEELRRGDLPRVIAVLEREIAGVRTTIEDARQALPQRASRRGADPAEGLARIPAGAARRCCTTPTIPKQTCAMRRATSPTSTTSSPPTAA